MERGEIMFNFGGNVLAENPKRFLPGSAILVYRRSNKEVLREWARYDLVRPDVTDYVQVASINNTRCALWSLLILRGPGGSLTLEIDHSAWVAFAEMPDLFELLANTSERFWSSGTARLTLTELIQMLESLGAVEQVE
jgi:hypothetical protein